MQQLIEHHSKRPDVSLGAIDMVNEPFRTHVEGRAYINIFEFSLGFDSESEVSNFGCFVFGQKHIRSLHISMDN